MRLTDLESMGAKVALNGDKLRLSMEGLPPEKRREVIELARTHKENLIRELSGPNRVDLAGLSDRLRAAGLHLHPRSCDRRIQIIDRHGAELPRTDIRPLPEYVTRNEARLYQAIHQARAAGSTAGLCEICSWADHSQTFSHGWRCGAWEGWPVDLPTARRNCPLAGRIYH